LAPPLSAGIVIVAAYTKVGEQHLPSFDIKTDLTQRVCNRQVAQREHVRLPAGGHQATHCATSGRVLQPNSRNRAQMIAHPEHPLLPRGAARGG
jgi:hypothetical protein